MLIAGGTGAIGSEIARQAIAAGWRVALHGRTEAKLAALVESLTVGASDDDDDMVRGYRADVYEPDEIVAMVDRVGREMGRIDAVIDSVAGGPGGGGITGAFKDTEPNVYLAFYDASIVHLHRLVHAAMPWLLKQGGTVIALASDAGKFAGPKQTLVGATRAAIMGFIRNLAVEVARDGIRAHCISPSFVDKSVALDRATGMGEGSRIEKARARAGLGLPTVGDVAPLAIFLCGDGARRMTGQVISINGGLNA